MCQYDRLKSREVAGHDFATVWLTHSCKQHSLLHATIDAQTYLSGPCILSIMSHSHLLSCVVLTGMLPRSDQVLCCVYVAQIATVP